MTLTGDGAPRPEQRPAVGSMTTTQLRRHLADDHGTTQTSGFAWLELVAEHNRSHRVWLEFGHEHDVPDRPES